MAFAPSSERAFWWVMKSHSLEGLPYSCSIFNPASILPAMKNCLCLGKRSGKSKRISSSSSCWTQHFLFLSPRLQRSCSEGWSLLWSGGVPVPMGTVVNSCCTGVSVALDLGQARCVQVWRDLSHSGFSLRKHLYADLAT